MRDQNEQQPADALARARAALPEVRRITGDREDVTIGIERDPEAPGSSVIAIVVRGPEGTLPNNLPREVGGVPIRRAPQLGEFRALTGSGDASPRLSSPRSSRDAEGSA